MSEKWHANAKGTQGIIYAYGTGRNVAVSYDVDDAKLIAAAPELLDALVNLLDVSHCTNGCDPNDMTCASNVARVAIEKATL